jgi:peroxiredoxin
VSCIDELRGLGAVRKILQNHGGDILAVSVDPVERLAQGRGDYPELPCRFASAKDGESLRALGLIHPLPSGKFVAAPANILVARGGTVAWAHYAEIVMDRPDPAEVLRVVEQMAR